MTAAYDRFQNQKKLLGQHGRRLLNEAGDHRQPLRP
jgi:hypothetical protein